MMMGISKRAQYAIQGILALAIAIPFAGCDTFSDSEDQNDLGLPSNPSPTFTHHITDLDTLKGIIPLGSVSHNTIANRSYLFNPRDENDSPIEVPIYAPVEMHLSSIAYYVEEDQDQYLLFFQVSKEVEIVLDHVTDPVGDIREVGPDSPANNTRTSSPSKNLQFEAGDLIGHTTGTRAGSWDFGLTNTTVENEFANMARYQEPHSDYLLHADCPYEYFESPLRETYEALYATQDGEPYEGATCRSASRDVPGTLSGAWFRNEEVSEHFGERLAIASDFDGQIRVGGLWESNLMVPADPEPAIDPAEVEVGDEACYHDPDSDYYAYFRMASETTIEVAKGSGSCPTAFPSGDANVYYR